IYTSWIETEFLNNIEPWSGESEEHPVQAMQEVVVEADGKRVQVTLPTRMLTGQTAPPPKRKLSAGVSSASGNEIRSPMQATVVKLSVAEGDRVVPGDLLLVLEAMKMEQPIVAHREGVVSGVNAPVGSTVSSGHLLLLLED
ncbi:MAG: acetyl-CoA carboxylase biotin carboxyl carrier protein subunit, partial [Microbacteriaceae bacterium]